MQYPVHEFKEKWYIAQGYGVKTDYGYHEADDINLKTGGDSDLGQELLAIADGDITSVHSHTKIPSFGKHLHLKIETPFGVRWAHYAHCQDILVSEGTKVKEGQLIAHLGKSGTTVAHCHFAIKKEPTGVDAIAKTLEDLAKWEDPIAFIERVMAYKEPSSAIPEPQEGLSERIASVELGLDKVEDELGRNTRRLDELQRTLDSVSADRDILEDIQGKLGELKETVKLNSESLVSTKKELRDEFRTTVEILENQIKEIEEPPLPGEGKEFSVIARLGEFFLGRRR
jgi:murein DD-endopeptidase MepM/ murein hydrolase activator NlpD